jgi:hypothetical protein
VPSVAQNKIVSPVTATTTSGSSNNVFPFANSTVRRYLQVHSDIGGSAKVLSKLSFRLPATATNYTGTMAIDMEMFMGNTVSWDRVSFLIDSNYVTPRTQVVARKIVNMGPQGQGVTPGPNPFANMDVVLDTPFTYVGVQSLGWEAVVYANTIVGSVSGFDTDNGVISTSTPIQFGIGCIATGRSAAMLHSPSLADVGGGLAIGFSLSNGPSAAQTVLAVGSTDPNLPLFGLCSNLRTNLLLVVQMGMTDASGVLAATGQRGLVVPNFGPGTLFTQMHAMDPGRADLIPICNSDGKGLAIPAPNKLKVVKVSRIFNSVGGTTATEAAFFNTSSVGYGLVTQFSY